MPVSIQCLANRLRSTRQLLEFTLEEVSLSSGITSERLEMIESGGGRPTGDEVLILASLYACDFRHLIDETSPDPSGATDILFRRYGDSFSPNDRRMVQEFLYFCRVEEWLQPTQRELTTNLALRASNRNFKASGKRAAELVREKLGYADNAVPRDIYEDFRKLGVHIFRWKLTNEEISGLYVEDPIAGHCVLINYSDDVYRQRFSVAHEVAHSIFDSSEGVVLTHAPSSSKYNPRDLVEIRANSFASAFLMPESMLRRIGAIGADVAIRWAQEFRVSTAALAKALKDASLIDESSARKIREVRVPRSEKIDPEAPESLTDAQLMRRKGLLERGLSDYYVGLCFSALDAKRMSVNRVAEAFRVDLPELADIALLYGRSIHHDF